METQRGLDQFWIIQLLAAAKRLVAMAMWQTYSADEAVEGMVNAIDHATWHIHHRKSIQTYEHFPITKKHAKRAIRYDIAALGLPIANLVRPYIKSLYWTQNSNYVGLPFAERYAYTEFIGPDGIAKSDNLRIGLLLMGKETHYPMHYHPASEIYFVLSGEGRFRVPNKPWRVCPIGQFVFHEPHVEHAIETRDQHLLALYFWREDVTTQAQLIDAK